jgi:uncharacterized protein (DUF1684 family)
MLPHLLIDPGYGNKIGHFPDQSTQDSIAMHKAAVEQYRAEKNARFANPESTPLPAASVAGFQGLSYFPIDHKYNLNATLVPASDPKRVKLNTSYGGTASYLKYGEVVFTLDGTQYTLSVFKNSDLPEFEGNPEQLFIPLKDATAGEQSNGNGRYIMVSAPRNGNRLTLDLNRAMNPYGAYNNEIPSVLPPPENVLTVPLPTGERKYDDR